MDDDLTIENDVLPEGRGRGRDLGERTGENPAGSGTARTPCRHGRRPAAGSRRTWARTPCPGHGPGRGQPDQGLRRHRDHRRTNTHIPLIPSRGQQSSGGVRGTERCSPGQLPYPATMRAPRRCCLAHRKMASEASSLCLGRNRGCPARRSMPLGLTVGRWDGSPDGRHRPCPITSKSDTRKPMSAGVDIGWWCSYGFSRSRDQKGPGDTNFRAVVRSCTAVRRWSSGAGVVAGWRRD